VSTRIRGEFNSDMLSFTDLPGGSQILTLFFINLIMATRLNKKSHG
jgi:hypothetical protein